MPVIAIPSGKLRAGPHRRGIGLRHGHHRASPLYSRPPERPADLHDGRRRADVAIERAARLADAWLWGPVQSLSKGQACLSLYRKACTENGKPADWILRRYAWIAPTRREVEDDVLAGYVDGLMEHWRESAEDEEEKALFARIDAGEAVSAQE